MATTTPNFGWPVPTSSDLVKNGATAIEGLGDAIDASLLDLKGGTTGQVLAKASGTDMDFTWTAIDPLVILDAKGDLITATAADTPARLAVGTNAQVLTADSTTATGLKWATPAASASGLTFITGTTFSAVSSFSLPNNTFTATYDNYLVRFQLTDASAASAVTLKLRAGGTDTSSGYYSAQYRVDYLLTVTSLGENATTSWGLGSINTGGTNQQIFQYDLNIKQPFNTKHTMVNSAGSLGNIVSSVGLLAKVDLTSYDALTFACSSGTITGNYRVYGYQNS